MTTVCRYDLCFYMQRLFVTLGQRESLLLRALDKVKLFNSLRQKLTIMSRKGTRVDFTESDFVTWTPTWHTQLLSKFTSSKLKKNFQGLTAIKSCRSKQVEQTFRRDRPVFWYRHVAGEPWINLTVSRKFEAPANATRIIGFSNVSVLG
ncbi:hypothetical protein Bca4012_001356 [Brassica carinata]